MGKPAAAPPPPSLSLVPGALVEVTGVEAGFLGSHHSARVVAPAQHAKGLPPGALCVQYDELVLESGAKETEHVTKRSRVRPALGPWLQELAKARGTRLPEPLAAYAPGDAVEVFHAEGWWDGFVQVASDACVTACFPYNPAEPPMRVSEPAHLRRGFLWAAGAFQPVKALRSQYPRHAQRDERVERSPAGRAAPPLSPPASEMSDEEAEAEPAAKRLRESEPSVSVAEAATAALVSRRQVQSWVVETAQAAPPLSAAQCAAFPRRRLPGPWQALAARLNGALVRVHPVASMEYVLTHVTAVRFHPGGLLGLEVGAVKGYEYRVDHLSSSPATVEEGTAYETEMGEGGPTAAALLARAETQKGPLLAESGEK